MITEHAYSIRIHADGSARVVHNTTGHTACLFRDADAAKREYPGLPVKQPAESPSPAK